MRGVDKRWLLLLPCVECSELKFFFSALYRFYEVVSFYCVPASTIGVVYNVYTSLPWHEDPL